MVLKRVVEMCEHRRLNKQDCEGCVYHGRTCNHTIKILSVNRPSDYFKQLNRR